MKTLSCFTNLFHVWLLLLMLLAGAQPQRYLRQEEAPEASTPSINMAETGDAGHWIDAHDDIAHDGTGDGRKLKEGQPSSTHDIKGKGYMIMFQQEHLSPHPMFMMIDPTNSEVRMRTSTTLEVYHQDYFHWILTYDLFYDTAHENEKRFQIKNGGLENNKCLQIDEAQKRIVVMKDCDETNLYQIWRYEDQKYYNIGSKEYDNEERTLGIPQSYLYEENSNELDYVLQTGEVSDGSIFKDTITRYNRLGHKTIGCRPSGEYCPRLTGHTYESTNPQLFRIAKGNCALGYNPSSIHTGESMYPGDPYPVLVCDPTRPEADMGYYLWEKVDTGRTFEMELCDNNLCHIHHEPVFLWKNVGSQLCVEFVFTKSADGRWWVSHTAFRPCDVNSPNQGFFVEADDSTTLDDPSNVEIWRAEDTTTLPTEKYLSLAVTYGTTITGNSPVRVQILREWAPEGRRGYQTWSVAHDFIGWS